MRLWSLHPRYLDSKGLGGVWREALLAQAVLLGKTTGWKNHPQLFRFQKHNVPLSAIGYYLQTLWEEARSRGYRYDKSKIVAQPQNLEHIVVSKGQLLYEFRLLKERLKTRSPAKHRELMKLEKFEIIPAPHPLFIVKDGDVEPWETSYWRTIRSNQEW